MGPHRTKALTLVALLAVTQAGAQEAGWHYSPLTGEGDRASMGCARGSSGSDFACLVVRCEDNFSTGLHVYTSRPGGGAGAWEMTIDRETRRLDTEAQPTPYSGRLADPEGWLLDRLLHGSYVYLRHADDVEAEFDFIDLKGSYQSIGDALYWCAPRTAPGQPIGGPDVKPQTDMEKHNESTSSRAQ